MAEPLEAPVSAAPPAKRRRLLQISFSNLILLTLTVSSALMWYLANRDLTALRKEHEALQLSSAARLRIDSPGSVTIRARPQPEDFRVRSDFPRTWRVYIPKTFSATLYITRAGVRHRGDKTYPPNEVHSIPLPTGEYDLEAALPRLPQQNTAELTIGFGATDQPKTSQVFTGYYPNIFYDALVIEFEHDQKEKSWPVPGRVPLIEVLGNAFDNIANGDGFVGSKSFEMWIEAK